MNEGLIVFLGTHDLDATDRFYREVLGFALNRDQGACRIYAVPGGGQVGFCIHIEVVQGERSPIITFVAEDVDSVYQRVTASGVAVDHPPQENPRYHIYHFFTKDPNGYTIEVQRFLD